MNPIKMFGLSWAVFGIMVLSPNRFAKAAEKSMDREIGNGGDPLVQNFLNHLTEVGSGVQEGNLKLRGSQKELLRERLALFGNLHMLAKEAPFTQKNGELFAYPSLKVFPTHGNEGATEIVRFENRILHLDKKKWSELESRSRRKVVEDFYRDVLTAVGFAAKAGPRYYEERPNQILGFTFLPPKEFHSVEKTMWPCYRSFLAEALGYGEWPSPPEEENMFELLRAPQISNLRKVEDTDIATLEIRDYRTFSDPREFVAALPSGAISSSLNADEILSRERVRKHCSSWSKGK